MENSLSSPFHIFFYYFSQNLRFEPTKSLHRGAQRTVSRALMDCVAAALLITWIQWATIELGRGAGREGRTLLAPLLATFFPQAPPLIE